MNEYQFMLDFSKQNISEPSFIICSSESWVDTATSHKIIGSMEPYIRNYLTHAISCRGHILDQTRYSPSKLYEALLGNTEWNVTVDGLSCDLPDNLLNEEQIPTDAID